MEENQQQNPWIVRLKKIWPTIYRILNTVFYFILSVIKNIVNGIISQLKGM